uniref:Protein outspread n=1 Tax=Glossina pallidipes TaxID=7398 RepID=A0A1A9ZVY1_GLOPL
MSSSTATTTTTTVMSASSSSPTATTRTSDCRKFSPNIFNKSKCSHCFRQREEHSAAALECNRESKDSLGCNWQVRNYTTPPQSNASAIFDDELRVIAVNLEIGQEFSGHANRFHAEVQCLCDILLMSHSKFCDATRENTN